MVNRRNFLYGSAAGAAGLLLTRGSSFAASNANSTGVLVCPAWMSLT